MWQDSRGLHFTCNLPDTSWARDLIALMERGDVSQMSFGFSVPPGGDDWSVQPDGTTLRTVNRATVYECSVVTIPAYSSTSVNLRSAPEHIKQLIRAKCAESQRELGTDDDFDDEDDVDEDGELCECRCAQCRDGDCDECSNAYCEDEACAACPIQERALYHDLILRRLRS